MLEEVFKSGHFTPPLGYEIVDWFVDEIITLENKMTFYFRNTKKCIIMTEEDKEDFENNNICRLCEKNKETNKVRDHCHLTGNYRGPAHSKCNVNVKQSQSNFISVVLHCSGKYDCHLFSKKLVEKKKDLVEYKILPKTNEDYISI